MVLAHRMLHRCSDVNPHAHVRYPPVYQWWMSGSAARGLDVWLSPVYALPWQ